jgi:hypothetical protein
LSQLALACFESAEWILLPLRCRMQQATMPAMLGWSVRINCPHTLSLAKAPTFVSD